MEVRVRPNYADPSFEEVVGTFDGLEAATDESQFYAFNRIKNAIKRVNNRTFIQQQQQHRQKQ